MPEYGSLYSAYMNGGKEAGDSAAAGIQEKAQNENHKEANPESTSAAATNFTTPLSAPAAPPPAENANSGPKHEADTMQAAASPPSTDTTDAAKTVGSSAEAIPDSLQTSAGAMATAQDLAAAQQGGAVNSAVGAARSAGLSPAQAAMLGANAGSSTYSNALGSNFYQGNQQRIAELLGRMGNNTTMRGQDIQEELGLKGVGLQQGQQDSAFWGQLLQAGATALPFILSMLAEGTESADGGPTIVGEHGAELVELPKGAKVTPIHDGFDMIQHGLKHALEGKAELFRKAKNAGASPKTLADMKPALNQAVEYIKGVKR